MYFHQKTQTLLKYHKQQEKKKQFQRQPNRIYVMYILHTAEDLSNFKILQSFKTESLY